MDDKINFMLNLLSAGVLAAFVTGIFTLIISIKNSKHLLKIEKMKQNFTLNQDRIKDLKIAYNELITQLPDKKRLCFVVGNNHSDNILSDVYNLSVQNVNEIHSHFYKYKYLLSNDDQKSINNLFCNLDEIAKEIISNTFKINNEKQEDIEESININLFEQIKMYILKSAELEELYFNIIEKAIC